MRRCYCYGLRCPLFGYPVSLSPCILLHHHPHAAPADPVLALGFLAVIIHGIINSEVALTKELNEKTPQMDVDGVWRGGGPGQAAETRYVGGGDGGVCLSLNI